MSMSTSTTPLRNESRSSVIIRTTLYDLVEAINAEAQLDEEDLVVSTVMHLLGTSRVTFPHRQEHYN
jgi:hypothetical protein